MEMALFVFFFFILKIIHALWEKFRQCRRVKAESRADPQMLLARPNSFGIWLFFFFFPYVDKTGYQVVIHGQVTLFSPPCS